MSKQEVLQTVGEPAKTEIEELAGRRERRELWHYSYYVYRQGMVERRLEFDMSGRLVSWK